jgi:cytohesin
VPEGSDDMIGLLLKAGANPNTRVRNGEIPLHAAARGWRISLVELLASVGSDVNAADKEGRTPAIVAFELGHYDMFDLMVGRGAKVSTDLMSAYKGNLSRVESLIEDGKAQEKLEQGLTLLHAASAGGHTAIVELLLTNGIDVRSKTQEGYTALHYAAAGNHRDLAELLLAKGADVNAEPGEQTPLHWAIREQHKEMVEWLLARGANPNADAFGTPLHWAVWWGDVDTASLLVSHGADIHRYTQSYPFSPLFDSVRGGARDMVDALVTKTGDTRAAKWAPLLAAAASGNKQATNDLLAKGADVNAQGERGFLALHLAAGFGHKDIVELLVEEGADVNAKAASTLWDEDMTVLHGACLHGQRGTAELLLAKGADVNARSRNGYTPLHVAVTRGYRHVAELLIAKGADVNAEDSDGRTPLSLAKDRGHTEIIDLLQKHGAKE